jgi:hypothetical protein
MIPKRSKNYDLNFLSENDINNNRCTLEKLERITPYLNKNNSELYKIYLVSRPDLGETVKEYYLNVINKIEANEKRYIDEALKILKDVSEYQN